ncbi:hypothetical protein V8G54_001704 [Vigna mungo]|uniref:Uncharacterized protein n=1 Tax=Vigna mungo TaxID=3915 RepID=A0AAQ3P7I3_VIGMU
MPPQIPSFHHLHSHHLLHSYPSQPQPARTRATRIKINQSIKLINEQNYFSVTWSRFSFFLSFLLTDLVLGRASASGSYPGGPAEPISFFSCTGRGKRSEKRRRAERKKKKGKEENKEAHESGLGLVNGDFVLRGVAGADANGLSKGSVGPFCGAQEPFAFLERFG